MRELHQGQKDSNPSITGRIYGSNPVTVSPTLGLAYLEETIYGLRYKLSPFNFTLSHYHSSGRFAVIVQELDGMMIRPLSS
jgi:hypothetical protein